MGSPGSKPHVFHNQLFIRGHENNICLSLYGLNAAGLYLFCISCKMPTAFLVRVEETKFEKVQLEATRIVTDTKFRTSLNELYLELAWLTLKK